MGFGLSVRWRWIAIAAMAEVACGSALGLGAAQRGGREPATSSRRETARRSIRLSPWEQAERARDAFEAEPEASRTKAEYTRVTDLFRAIYHDTPRDLHAAEAVNSVAELLAEEGRTFHDAKMLKAAVGQYEFLRTQYPGSSLRVGALLAQGQLEENDLRDAAAARERYELLLEQFPRSSLAEEARAGVASLDNTERLGRAQAQRAPLTAARTNGTDASTSHEAPTANALRSPKGLKGSVQAPSSEALAQPEQPFDSKPPATGKASSAGSSRPPTARDAEAAAAASLPAPVSRVLVRNGKPATVTGIRHWSTPSYTRVAIDLGGEVEYEAARVPNPDRIYFDLHGARLAQDLVGKSFPVTDDGFLKKIRVAQGSGDLARVVLDVNEVTEYSAFLLPNPYRLIIDIHGGAKPPSQQTTMMDAPAKPAPTVPNTRAVNAGGSADVARLSEQPGKIEATSVPTSKPIAAVVAGRSRTEGGGRSDATDSPAGSGVAAAAGAGTVPAAASPASSSGTTSSLDTGAKSSASRKGRKGRATAADGRVVGDPAMPARAAVPTADGETSLIRALGLKIGRIVIDAGHGGHDSGTIGVDGLEEKDVVLDVALRLGRMLKERLGAEVIFTRSDDTFVPLETRTAIANKAQADLFLSIHANSSVDASARGVETYYLNFTQQADALQVAARENAVSDQSIYQLSDLVKKIAMKDKIAESREFAGDVEASLYGGLARGNEGLRNRGVKKAPFVVLIGANMPSVLAEISFVTNSRDATQLREPDYRERVAESLYKGVARYASGLSGARPAPVVAAERADGR